MNKNTIEWRARKVASSNLFTSLLPDNFDEMNSADKDIWAMNHVCEIHEYEPCINLWNILDNTTEILLEFHKAETDTEVLINE